MNPAIGQTAPDFTVHDQDGKPVTLSALKGKKVVLYFYPKDMTPGCTLEACSLRDHYKTFQKQGFVVLGVSSDDEKSHRKFIEKEKLPFQLLADTDKKVHGLYGTWVEKSMYGRKYMGTARVTFVIDERGIIENVITQVNTKDHANQILSGSSTAVPTKTKPAAARKAKAIKEKSPAPKKTAPKKKVQARKSAPKKSTATRKKKK